MKRYVIVHKGEVYLAMFSRNTLKGIQCASLHLELCNTWVNPFTSKTTRTFSDISLFVNLGCSRWSDNVRTPIANVSDTDEGGMT